MRKTSLPIYLSATALFMAGVSLPSLAAEYTEAPELAESVAAGELPPVEERLPTNPEVIVPHEMVGEYGGEIRFGISGTTDQESISYWSGNQGLVRYDPATNYSTVLPNLAASYEISEDNTTFTFKLREGVKWSDGTPLTAEDVAFSMNDLILNEEWAQTSASFLAGGEPPTVTVLDPLTVEFKFSQPYGAFLYELAHYKNLGHIFFQEAYCGQFHPDHASDLEGELTAAGLDDWRTLMDQRCGHPYSSPSRFGNPERPSLEAWIVTEPYSAGSSQVVMERNPYFWAVDTEGNQLPYVDRVVGTIYSDPQAMLLAAIGGSLDFGFRHLDSSSNRPVLAQNRESGGYDLYEVTAIGGSLGVFYVNLTHKDPVKRELFSNKDFRIALSQGMNRQELIDTVFLGVGQPHHNAPFADSPMYHGRYASQYLEFDPDRANELLDQVGLTERNADGIRLMEDGRPLRIDIEIPAAPPELSDMIEIMSLQWGNIGVDLNATVVDRTLMFQHIENNDHDAAIWSGAESWLPGRPLISMVPIDKDSRWAIAWADWAMSGGELGEEPPAHVLERIELNQQLAAHADIEKRKEIVHQIADIAADEFELFGTIAQMSSYGIKKTDLANVRSSTPNTGQYPPSLMLPWTWFWKD